MSLPSLLFLSLVLFLSLILPGCESAKISSSQQQLEVAKPITLTPKQIASVRAGVARNLKTYDLEDVRFGRMIAGRTTKAVIVCGYANGKNMQGEYVGEKPFHGLFLGMDNASGFIVTGTGTAAKDNAETFEICRRSGLDLTSS